LFRPVIEAHTMERAALDRDHAFRASEIATTKVCQCGSDVEGLKGIVGSGALTRCR